VHDFVRKLITEWRRLEVPTEDVAVVVAVSGGADSLSLLLAMHQLVEAGKLKLRIVAAHFNHGLRSDESDRDEHFVQKLTSELNVEFAAGRSKPFPMGNVEQNARNARYEFLTNTAKNLGASVVVTGHTINDQAETFLINLIRGSGPDGLSGMRPVRQLVSDDSTVLLVRPLMTWCKRIETEGFCRDSGVEYLHDTMNDDTAYKRVRIRKILLPLLEDFNPNIIEVLANTSFLLAKTVSADEKGNRNAAVDELNIREIKELGESELYDVIRGWLTHLRGNTRQLGLKHIRGVARLVLSTKSGRTVEIPGGRVLKTGGRLRYDDNKVEKTGFDN